MRFVIGTDIWQADMADDKDIRDKEQGHYTQFNYKLFHINYVRVVCSIFYASKCVLSHTYEFNEVLSSCNRNEVINYILPKWMTQIL